VPFGDYKPDLARLANDGLAIAKNTVPITGGYDGVNSLADVSNFTALSSRARGAASGIDPAGNPFNFVGTDTKLYRLQEATDDVTRILGGAYNTGGQGYWEFGFFSKTIIAVNGSDRPQYFTLDDSTEFKPLGNPGLTNTTAPTAKHIGVIGTFVVLGNTANDPSEVHWSAVNDPFNWPTPGTEVAVTVQSDRQALFGPGGSVQRVVSGAEVGAIFQERAIWRAEYRGGDVVFELSRVEPERGLLIPAIAIPFGRQVFYLAEDGFYLFDYTSSTPIGRGIIDSTFLADIDTSLFHRVSASADPDNQRIWILYPGSGHDIAGTPNKFLVYDWGLNRWSHGEITAEWLTQSVHSAVTLDLPVTGGGNPTLVTDPDATIDSAEFPDGGVDGVSITTSLPLASFDDRVAAPGALSLGAYSTAHTLQQFTGSRLNATLQTGRRELIPGSRAMVTGARVMVDAIDPTVSVSGVGRANETDSFTIATRIDNDGDAPLRKDGRFHTFKLNLGSGFNDAMFMDVQFQRSGSR